jgi:hypothetical protein
MSAHGGPGAVVGAAGTVLIESAPNLANEQVIVDNGGSPAVATTLLSIAFSTDLTVSGGAKAGLGASTLRNLLVTSNSWLTITNWGGYLTITSNATVQAGGGITLDGLGSPGGAGTGAGHSLSSPPGLTGSGGG